MWIKWYPVCSGLTTSRAGTPMSSISSRKATPRLPCISHNIKHGARAQTDPVNTQGAGHWTTGEHQAQLTRKVKTYCYLSVQETQPSDHSILCFPLSEKIKSIVEIQRNRLIQTEKLWTNELSQVRGPLHCYSAYSMHVWPQDHGHTSN